MIGLALHLGACALDELFEVFEEFRADLGWVATVAAGAARMGLAARLDPEAHRKAYGPYQPPPCPSCGGPGWTDERGWPGPCGHCAECYFQECHDDTLTEARHALCSVDELRHLAAQLPGARDEAAQLRAERDRARAQRDLEHLIERDDAQTLAHEAKLEFSAARETCEQLRGELADWRGIAASEQREAAEVRVQLDELRGLALNAIESRERLKVANGGGVATDSEAMVIRVDCQDAWAALVKAVTP